MLVKYSNSNSEESEQHFSCDIPTSTFCKIMNLGQDLVKTNLSQVCYLVHSNKAVTWTGTCFINSFLPRTYVPRTAAYGLSRPRKYYCDVTSIL
jgi:hypothetical protein